MKVLINQKYKEIGGIIMHDSSCVFAIIDQTVQSSSRSLSVKELCQIAGVSRSGYYAWKKAEQTRKAQEEQDRKDFELFL